ncbi:hypothetical protein [Mesotoga sp. BH458_6_3_2_1]|uniref:hypothetical protein n=1 Tax=Mesotoga sp. BH458_6_3_2_1 TaxID=1437446 RepID=UPI000EF1A7F4|nr:hypothetical protein [Mesotoga sp. BH458_6_3_2_1]RLL82922.1 hypothetical protein Y697_00025 [Mesotoga sp. BH458_6_3_2_1]
MFKKILVFLSLFTLIALGGCSLFRAIKIEIPDQQVTEGEELVVDLNQFVLSSVSDGISFLVSSGPGRIDGKSYIFTSLPGDGENSPFKVRVSVRDEGKSGVAEFRINVSPIPEGEKAEIKLSGETAEESEEIIDDFVKRNPENPEGHAIRGAMKAIPQLLKLLDIYNSQIGSLDIAGTFDRSEMLSGFEELVSNPDQVVQSISTDMRARLLNMKLRSLLILRNPELLVNFLASSSSVAENSGYSTCGEIGDFQDEMEEYADSLQEVWDDISYLSGEMNIVVEVFLNEFDWDEDGAVESDRELVLEVVSKEDSITYTESLRLYTDILFLEKEPKGDHIVSIEVDPDGGDAVFDLDFWFMISQGLEIEYAPGFDENDYLVIDEGEIAILKMLVGSALSSARAFTVYDLEPSEAFMEYVEDADDDEIDPPEIDTNSDGNIDASEVKAFIGTSFLTFRNPSKSPLWLSSIRDIALEAPETTMLLAEDLLKDTQTEDNKHNLTSQWYIPFDQDAYDALAESSSEQEELLDYIRPNGEDLDTEMPVDEDEKTIILRLYNIFDHPERFSDLLSYFPILINYEMLEGIEFPDPTFGGVVVNLPKSISPDN